MTGVAASVLPLRQSAVTGSKKQSFITADPARVRAMLTHVAKTLFVGNGGAGQLINSGGGYRITNTQQIDFHIGFGLNRNSPAYIFGVGYS